MDLLLIIIEMLFAWGIVVGLVIGFSLAYVISHFLWGELNLLLIGCLSLFFAILGAIVQSIVVEEQKKRR